MYWALRDPDQTPATRGLAMLAILMAVGLGPLLTVLAGWMGLVPRRLRQRRRRWRSWRSGGGLFAYASPFTAAPAITASPPNMRGVVGL